MTIRDIVEGTRRGLSEGKPLVVPSLNSQRAEQITLDKFKSIIRENGGYRVREEEFPMLYVLLDGSYVQEGRLVSGLAEWDKGYSVSEVLARLKNRGVVISADIGDLLGNAPLLEKHFLLAPYVQYHLNLDISAGAEIPTFEEYFEYLKSLPKNTRFHRQVVSPYDYVTLEHAICSGMSSVEQLKNLGAPDGELCPKVSSPDNKTVISPDGRNYVKILLHTLVSSERYVRDGGQIHILT